MQARDRLARITDPMVAAGGQKTYEIANSADSFARTVAFAVSQPDSLQADRAGLLMGNFRSGREREPTTVASGRTGFRPFETLGVPSFEC
jgi:hypothetical protein